MVAAEFGRLRERELFLEREVQAARAEGDVHAPVDDETMIQRLGEESVRVLTTARESANVIRTKAEESAAQLLSEAGDEATRVREEADIEAARRRSDAAADAEAELSMAKQQGREMVTEARAYRERVLSELARRRELAREQIEQLIHGRDRLTQAFERARLVAVDVVAEMQPLGEPDEYVNLTPTTGPLPVMIANSPRPDDTDSDGGIETDTETDAENATAFAETETETVEDSPIPADAGGDLRIVDPDDATDVEEVADVEEVTAPATEPESDVATTDTDADLELELETDDEAGDDVVVDLFARLRADNEADNETASDAGPEAESETVAPAEGREEADVAEPDAAEPDVAEADVAEADGAASEDAESDDDVEPSDFERRDEVITPLIVSSAKKLKRALADEQNDVLDALRRSDAVNNLDALLPWESEHSARYAEAVADDLLEAVHQGSSTSRLINRKIRKALAAEAVDVANEALVQWLVVPLRDRLERCIAEGEGDNAAVTKKVRAVYREWKTQRIDETLDDVMRRAHGRGVLAGFDLDTPIVWEVDERFPACPDCEDNVLAGAIAAGAEFPTGDAFAPAHQGCRCLLVAADR